MPNFTGHAHLDRLIDEFRSSHVGTREGELLVEDLIDPQHAALLCNLVSQQFAQYLRSHGYDAECMSEDGWLAEGPDDWGYGDHTIPGCEQHDLVLVAAGQDRDWLIDWTAAQYGYADFPMIQMQLADGSIVREWPEIMPPVMSDEIAASSHIPSDAKLSR